MNKEQFLSDILLLPTHAVDYSIGRNLTTLFPERAMIEGEGGHFNVEQYADAQFCVLTKKIDAYHQMITHWIAPEREELDWQYDLPSIEFFDLIDQDLEPSKKRQETCDRVKKAWLEVSWQGHSLDVLLLYLETNPFCSPKPHYWILAESQEVARNFFSVVSQWNIQIRREVLVFESGYWQKDPHLFQDIKNATFDNLILQGALKQEIRDDLKQFFASRALYEEHDIPWKRGILLLGPAGNGKTHTVKALINTLRQPCLYVKNFRAPNTHGADEVNISKVFDRARKVAPCILVLEDLDSLITAENRSFFLNELDGFASNIGIVTLATTNHQEKLDPAILERPSRFDRKYTFDLPEYPERLAYTTLWNDSLRPDLKLSSESLTHISTLTDGFSFAYLKELVLSSKMRWIANQQQRSMEEVVIEQIHMLREQMANRVSTASSFAVDEQKIQQGSVIE